MLRLELNGISKQYPAVRANDGVNLRVQARRDPRRAGRERRRQEHADEDHLRRGAPDEGSIRWNGQPVQVANPQQARALGISMVFQHFSLFDTLTAAENVWLGWTRPTRCRRCSERITEVAHTTGWTSTRCARCTR
jgi:ABC-type uncharacterized transport system ATPase subunit